MISALHASQHATRKPASSEYGRTRLRDRTLGRPVSVCNKAIACEQAFQWWWHLLTYACEHSGHVKHTDASQRQSCSFGCAYRRGETSSLTCVQTSGNVWDNSTAKSCNWTPGRHGREEDVALKQVALVEKYAHAGNHALCEDYCSNTGQQLRHVQR